MSIYVDENKNISFYKGDTGNITFSNLPVDKNYTVYFAISNPETNKIVGEELSLLANKSSTVTFSLSSAFTDSLVVLNGETYSVYNYGLKICCDGDEYTLIPRVVSENGKTVFSDPPKVYVYQKYVEGMV